MNQNQVLIDLMFRIKMFYNSETRNQWILFDYGKIYVRKSFRNYSNKLISCFDIANVEFDEHHRGKGFFKTFLNELKNVYPSENIFVESILNEKFYLFLRKEGFKEIDEKINKNLIFIK